MMSFRCAHCGSDSIRKVSSIVQEGTYSTMTQGQIFGAAYIPGTPHQAGHIVPAGAVMSSQTISKSALAQQLSPRPFPTKDSLVGPVLCFLLGIGACAGITHRWLTLYAEKQFHRGDYVLFTILFALCIPAVAGLIFLLISAHGDMSLRHQQAVMEWNAYMKWWNRQYYCYRCGDTFDPTVLPVLQSRARS